MKILAISGSARSVSTNTALLNMLKVRAPLGVELFVFHQLDILPVFSPDSEGVATPKVIADFIAQVAAADGIIISSPECIRAIPGGLKNAIDWMVSRFEVVGKPIVLAHASHRGDDMLTSLRLVLTTVSENFHEGIFLRIPLLGKSLEEIESSTQKNEFGEDISLFLSNFIEFVESTKVQ